jgi:hypothetical protein
VRAIKTSIYDELAAYIMVGDYSPIIAIGASLLMMIFIYLLILRPIINHLVLINVSAQLAHKKRNIIIKDKKYKSQEIKKMREELLKNESKKLEINLRNSVNNFIDSLAKILNMIIVYIIKIIERFKYQKKSKTINVKNTVEGENHEGV